MRFPQAWHKSTREPLTGGEAVGHSSEAPWKDNTSTCQEQ